MSMPFIKASNTRRDQAITYIIESIALEECAISHILNAEGEILQKVVEFPHLCSEEITIVNNSISDLIRHIVCLELELKGKLEMIKEYFCGCYHEDDRQCCNAD